MQEANEERCYRELGLCQRSRLVRWGAYWFFRANSKLALSVNVTLFPTFNQSKLSTLSWRDSNIRLFILFHTPVAYTRNHHLKRGILQSCLSLGFIFLHSVPYRFPRAHRNGVWECGRNFPPMTGLKRMVCREMVFWISRKIS